MFVVALFFRQNLRFAWRQHLNFMALGLCLFSANFTCFYYAGQFSASGLLAVVFSTASLINVLMLAVITRSRPELLHMLAAVIGMGGVALLYLPELRASTGAFLSLGLCLGGTLFFCTGNMVSAATQKAGLPVIAANSWGMAYGALFLGVFAMVRGQSFIIETTAPYLVSLLWLVVISSVLTFTAYLTLLGRIGPGRAGYATVVFPVFALMISTAFESYQWTVFAVLGLFLVVGGNVIMARSRS
jgi:drug/metabolite transporter (DMT)-like permease